MSVFLHHRCALPTQQELGLRQRTTQHFSGASRFQVRRLETNRSALGIWDRIINVFSGGKASEDVVARKRLRLASLELQELLCASTAPDLLRVNVLLDELVGAEGQPFSEKSLGGGPWVVRYTRGKPLLWNLTYSTGRLVNSRNRAAQAFDPAARSALNLVEINGPDNRIEAAGTFEPVDDSPVTPKTIRANISSGRLVLGPWELPLPISGAGFFEVLYVDDALRVFRSNGRFVVQIRADRLAQEPRR